MAKIRSGEWGDHVTLQAAADSYGVKILLITSFRDTCCIEIFPNAKKSNRASGRRFTTILFIQKEFNIWILFVKAVKGDLSFSALHLVLSWDHQLYINFNKGCLNRRQLSPNPISLDILSVKSLPSNLFGFQVYPFRFFVAYLGVKSLNKVPVRKICAST
uniref:OTU domain-containing protein n=1 Tax=Salix viminalis TaxID=40686 RepID=A0A6N2LSS8_SALVM